MALGHIVEIVPGNSANKEACTSLSVLLQEPLQLADQR